MSWNYLVLNFAKIWQKRKIQQGEKKQISNVMLKYLNEKQSIKSHLMCNVTSSNWKYVQLHLLFMKPHLNCHVQSHLKI